MMVGGILGVLFVSLVRRVMVEDPELPFPESVAAAEIHKAGQRGAEAAKYLFWNIGVGGVVYLLGRFGLFARGSGFPFRRRQSGHSQVRLGPRWDPNVVATGGSTSLFAAPTVSPAYMGVGYIIGLGLAAIQFSGGVLAWGLLVPLLIYFLGPQLQAIPAGAIRRENWAAHGGGGMAIHCASHRGRRNAGGRRLHAVQDAQELDGGIGQSVLGYAANAVNQPPSWHEPNVYEFEDRLRADWLVFVLMSLYCT